MIARCAGTVSSRAPSRLRSTRRFASSGTSVSTGSPSARTPSSTNDMVAAAAIGLDSDAMRKIASRRQWNAVTHGPRAERLDMDVVTAGHQRGHRWHRAVCNQTAQPVVQPGQPAGVEARGRRHDDGSTGPRVTGATLPVGCARGDPPRRRAHDSSVARGARGRASRPPDVVRGREGLRLGTTVLQSRPAALRRGRAAPSACPGAADGRPGGEGGGAGQRGPRVLHDPALRRVRRRPRRAPRRHAAPAAGRTRGCLAGVRTRAAGAGARRGIPHAGRAAVTSAARRRSR